ncbi:MAG: hypothetical protein H6891_04355 [Brucellaceae bacterium]|nr:hypothetical protein [Brucellaceae bacterium]
MAGGPTKSTLAFYDANAAAYAAGMPPDDITLAQLQAPSCAACRRAATCSTSAAAPAIIPGCCAMQASA